MVIKNALKKVAGVRKAYSRLSAIYFDLLTVISPKMNTEQRFKDAFKRKIDLENPKTLNEKILWLKLNNIRNPLVVQCADKYAVREYVQAQGCGDILNELYGVYDRAEDIDWDNLPKQFVLKWNFGAGMNVICTDKSKLDRDTVIRQLSKWGKAKPWLSHSEMQYKYMPKRIVCEALIGADKEVGL